MNIEMELMGQGIVLMIVGMIIVYAFLIVLIWVSNGANRFVSRFDHIIPDTETKKQVKRQQSIKSVPQGQGVSKQAAASRVEVKVPVPGTILRLSVSDGQNVSEGDEVLVMDVMKMETPIAAPCSGCISVKVAVMDKVATGDVVAEIA